MKIRPYTDKEWKELPHVILTSEEDWDSSGLNLDIDNENLWYDSITDDYKYPIS